MLPEPTLAAIVDELRQIKLLLGAVAARQAAGPSAGQLAELLGGRTLLIPVKRDGGETTSTAGCS